MSGTSILNFDTGISRVVWDHTGGPAGGTLPDRRQLPPSDLAAGSHLDRLLQPDNVGASLIRSARPSVESPDILSPSRFEAGLQTLGRALDRALSDVSGLTAEDQQALEGLDKVLREHHELQNDFHYYRDMLIAG
jgi:hypothetical protein